MKPGAGNGLEYEEKKMGMGGLWKAANISMPIGYHMSFSKGRYPMGSKSITCAEM